MSHNRNITFYPWYAAFHNAFFWMPVFFLYFSSHLSLSHVLQLEVIYYTAVVVLEVPSGYLSDRFGRKVTLVASAVSLLFAYCLFFAGSTFAVFAVAQFGLAAGIALNSGTDTSFHFDSLAALGKEDEYEKREAIVARNSLLATALAALVGGGVASIELGFAYICSAIFAGLTLALAIVFREPQSAKPFETAFLGQISRCLGQLKRPDLAWLFGFAIFAIVINHVPYEFYQTYLDLLSFDIGLPNNAAATAGIHMGTATLVGSFVARQAPKVDNMLGTGPTLLVAGIAQIAIIFAAGLFLHPLVAGVLVFRAVPSALIKAPLNAAVTPKIPQNQRATYLSLQSLAGRLGFAALLLSLSWTVAGKPTTWSTLSSVLIICGLIGIVIIVILGIGLWKIDGGVETG